MSRPLVAVTGRRLGSRVTKWPYANAPALPGAYFESVRRANAIPVMLDVESLTDNDAAALLARFDALMLTGGPDVDPATYGQDCHDKTYGTDRPTDDFELTLARVAVDRGVRTLAICRGIQVLNVALGGSLHQHIADLPGVEPHGRPGEADGRYEHAVRIQPGSLLSSVMGTSEAICSCHHHQAVDKLGDGLAVSAHVDGIVEGVELPGANLLAVQWHPEDTAAADPAQQRLFDWLAT
jgi:putative glutamine amidotransferase